jgi:hypothetical protein
MYKRNFKKKSNKRNNNQVNIRTHLRNNIPFNTGMARRTINTVIQIPTYHTSTHYTLAAGSDTRYIQFSTVLSALEFSTLAAAWQSYKIIAAAALICPGWNGNSADTALNFLPMLFMNIQPSKVGINPTNLEVLASDDSHVFSAYSTIKPQTVSFDLKQAGLTTDIWIDSASLPTAGNFVIGDSGISMAGTNDFYIFDAIISLTVLLRNTK